MSSLTPITAHLTLNSPTGTSTFTSLPLPSQPIGPSSNMTYIYSAPSTFSISTSTDLTHHNASPLEPPLRSFPSAGATGCVIIDFGPNPEQAEGFMHRTKTLDYIVVLEGELELCLWDAEKAAPGERKVFKQGEMVIQRAVWHAWRNVGGEKGARMMAFCVGEEGAVEGGMEVR